MHCVLFGHLRGINGDCSMHFLSGGDVFDRRRHFCCCSLLIKPMSPVRNCGDIFACWFSCLHYMCSGVLFTLYFNRLWYLFFV